MLLVKALYPVEDRDGLDQRGLVDEHRLEAALQRGILLDVLAVLVEGGGADALDLTPGQGRLEKFGRFDGPLGRACADQRVELVDEEHDLTAGADLIEDFLQALLELAAV